MKCPETRKFTIEARISHANKGDFDDLDVILYPKENELYVMTVKNLRKILERTINDIK